MAPDTSNHRWPDEARRARLHFVSGKGGTGKSTVAAALALALAAEGKKVLLVETEGRQGIAQLFDLPPLPPTDTKVATATGGGAVYALALDLEHALLEYLDMFYSLGFAGKAMKRIGAIEFATTVAPGVRDVLLTGKIKERVVAAERGRPLYDAVVVDSPPTGRIGSFLDVTKAMADLAKTGPVRSQAEGVIRLLHGPQTSVHLVTLLESLPVQETLEALDELTGKELPVGAVFVNRMTPPLLPAELLTEAADGVIDAEALRVGLTKAGIHASEADVHGLLTETIEHAVTVAAQRAAAASLDEAEHPTILLPDLEDGADLGGLYELAELLRKAGV